MPKIGVNLEDVQSGFQVLPEGDYLLAVKEGSKLGTSNQGNPKIGWVCEVLDGEFEGSRAYFETSLVPDALWKVKQLVEALGISFDEDGFELEDAFDLEFMAHLAVRPWDGRDFQDASDFKPFEPKKKK